MCVSNSVANQAEPLPLDIVSSIEVRFIILVLSFYAAWLKEESVTSEVQKYLQKLPNLESKSPSQQP